MSAIPPMPKLPPMELVPEPPNREGRLAAARERSANLTTRQMRRLALGPKPAPKPTRFTPPATGAPAPWIATLTQEV